MTGEGYAATGRVQPSDFTAGPDGDGSARPSAIPADRWTEADRELVAEVLYRLQFPDSTETWERIVAEDAIVWMRFRPEADAVLDALTAAGKLLPEPDHTHTEWGVWWHAGNPDGICLDAGHLVGEQDAHREGQSRIGEYLIDSYTVVRREHRIYPDGTWTGEWQRHSGPHEKGETGVG